MTVLCDFLSEFNPNKMYEIAFGLTLFWMFANILSVEVRRDEKWPPKMLLEWYRPAAKECREKTGVTEEAINEFDRGEIHEDASLKCYMFCVFEVLDLISSKGDLFVMRLADHIDSNYDEEVRNIAYQMGKQCLHPPENSNNCEKAFYYHRCWKEKDPVHYFLI